MMLGKLLLLAPISDSRVSHSSVYLSLDNMQWHFQVIVFNILVAYYSQVVLVNHYMPHLTLTTQLIILMQVIQLKVAMMVTQPQDTTSVLHSVCLQHLQNTSAPKLTKS